MKVTTDYGSASILQKKEKNGKSWTTETAISFIVTAMMIICVVGYIAYELNDKYQRDNKSMFGDIDNSMKLIALADNEHLPHIDDPDLDSMSSNVYIDDCADDDDYSYDIIYGEYSYEQDIQSVLNGVVNNWNEFEEELKKTSDDDSFLLCFKEQLVNNGSIQCNEGCSEPKSVSFASSDGVVNFCEDSSLDLLAKEVRPNRRSCIFQQITSQFSDLCGASDLNKDEMAENAFTWYKTKYDAETDWISTSCP